MYIYVHGIDVCAGTSASVHVSFGYIHVLCMYNKLQLHVPSAKYVYMYF